MKTDLQLIQDVKSGAKQSFEVLMLRHEKFLMKVIVRMTRDLDAAEDIVQDAFIKAYKRLHVSKGARVFGPGYTRSRSTPHATGFANIRARPPLRNRKM